MIIKNMSQYYKSFRWVNGKLTKVISEENGDIIKHPTIEQIKLAKIDNIKKIIPIKENVVIAKVSRIESIL